MQEGKDPNTLETTKDRAASMIYPLKYERALTNRIGLGGQLVFAKYFDTSTVSATARDIALELNFHLINRSGIDIYTGGIVGYSGIKITDTNNDAVYQGGGMNMGLALHMRLFLGKSIYIPFNFSYVVYNYANGRFKDNTGNDFAYPLKATGKNFGIGLGVKI